MHSYPVHLVCSSGGVKCFSYIGAIRELLRQHITIASVSTCSMGTVIGALVCSGLAPDELEARILNFRFASLKRRKTIFPLNLLRYPFDLYHMPDFAAILMEVIGKDPALGALAIPFSTAALDLRQRRMLAYSSDTHPEMKLSEVIRIATAIPGAYAPFSKGKRLLVDAAVASESPVWMAASYPGQHPIIVLKPAPVPDEGFRSGIGRFLEHLFYAAAGSHDVFGVAQIPRAITVDIPCGNIRSDDFGISRQQVEGIILEGESAMEKRLKDFDGDFNHILEVEEIRSPAQVADTADRAAVAANRMINRFQYETGSRNQVFISYSRKDQDWLERFQAYMKTIERFTGIKVWDDTAIPAGAAWEQEIANALRATRVAVFLVTPDFLASDFIREKEMEYFFRVSEREKVTIFWVAVSHTIYDITPLARIQCANNPARPLDRLSEGEQNEEITEICKAILDAMDGAG